MFLVIFLQFPKKIIEIKVTKREEIKSLISNYSVNETWLAKQLGIKKDTFDFILNDSVQLDEEFYEKTKEILDDFQYELTFDETAQDDTLDLFVDTELIKGIGERIRQFARKKYGTLKRLADEMEISPQQLQQYISGKREPGSRILLKLQRLGCDVNWLLGGTDSSDSFRVYNLENEVRKYQKGIAEIDKILQRMNSQGNL